MLGHCFQHAGSHNENLMSLDLREKSAVRLSVYEMETIARTISFRTAHMLVMA